MNQEVNELEIVVESVTYNNTLLSTLFVEVFIGPSSCIKISGIEICRDPKNGFLEIEMPYKESLFDYSRTSCISLEGFLVKKLRKAIEEFLEENPEFEDVLKRRRP